MREREENNSNKLFGQCLFKGTRGIETGTVMSHYMTSPVSVWWSQQRYVAARASFPSSNYTRAAIHNIDVYTRSVFIIHNAFFIIIHGNESEKYMRMKSESNVT